MTDQAIHINRPNGIAIFRLLALKGRINLESKGLKFGRVSTRSMVAAELGLKPRDKHEMFITAIEAKVKEIEAKGDLGIN